MTAAKAVPSVVLSLGLGVDSTAILLRWLREPQTRDFDLGEIIAVTAHTGNEWPDTIELANAHLLPLMAAHHVRYAQVARAGASQRDGITVLADTRTPERLITTGGYTLAESLLCAGTIPQSSGDRRHSVNFKGVPLDKFIATVTAGRPYRHVIGFEATEGARAERDARHGPPERTPAYPLIEWGWDRQACSEYIRQALGVDWPKSACTYCPFALTPASQAATLARFAAHPEQATLPLLMEFVATALNPRQGLIAGRRLADLMRRLPAQATALGIFGAALDTTEWAVYEVQRARLPRGTTRRVSIHATGPRNAVHAILGGLADRLGAHVEESDGHPRAWLRRPAPNPPTTEWFYVTAPATATPKTGPGFAKAWAIALDADQPALFTLADHENPSWRRESFAELTGWIQAKPPVEGKHSTTPRPARRSVSPPAAQSRPGLRGFGVKTGGQHLLGLRRFDGVELRRPQAPGSTGPGTGAAEKNPDP